MNRSIPRKTSKSRLDTVREMSPSRGGVVLRCEMRHERWTGPPHHHDELEVNLVTQGRASYLLEGRRYDIGARAMLWIFPHQSHLLFEHSSDFVMWIAVFRPQLVLPLEAEKGAISQGWNRTLTRESHRALDEQFKTLHNTTWSDSHYDLGLSWLLVSCRKAFDKASEGVEGESVHPSVAKAAHALRNEGMNWNLDQLARHSGASASWLSRLFGQQMGISLTDFRNRQRFERFSELYGRGQRLTLSQAALEAGFGSYAQFHRVAQSVTSLSPRDWSRDVESEREGNAP
ncbi:MAG TPA: helix-turn-helix transcriptional regulator [Abditibacterium sp.]|jgi:AraC-like DNA-binding protein